jgi:hypothetical protein
MGNLQVRFLEGWAPAMAPGYSTLMAWRYVRVARHPTRIRPDDVVSPDAWLRKPVENSKGRDVFWLLQLCVFRLGFLLRVNISIRLIAPLSEMSVTFCV